MERAARSWIPAFYNTGSKDTMQPGHLMAVPVGLGNAATDTVFTHGGNVVLAAIAGANILAVPGATQEAAPRIVCPRIQYMDIRK